MSIWKKEYASIEEFSDDKIAGYDELLAVVYNANHDTVCADLVTVCKNWQTAVRRFFKALAGDSRFDGWQECITEAIENNYWSEKETYWNTKTGKSEYRGGWFWKVENLDGKFYVCLNVPAYSGV